jgi:UDP-N-acetylmuramoyl-L-alanyl-D-glutamate--2,6-diaminopimelate ligase
MDDYAATKLTLFTDELEFSTNPVAVVNVDDVFGRRVADEARCPVVTVSAAGADDATVRVVRSELTLGGIEAELEVDGRSMKINSPLIGEHNVSNLAVALGIAHALALPLEEVARGIAALDKVPGRVEPVHDPRGSVVLVDYAHTPDALSQVTKTISAFTGGRLIVLFGCGGDRDQTKRPLMGSAAAAHGDIVIVTSDNPRTEDPEAIIEMALPGVESSGLPQLDLHQLAGARSGYAVEPDRRRAIAAAIAAAGPDDVVLIAGKGHEDYQILGERKIHFDDREEAAAAIKAIVAQGERKEVEETYKNV